jgi:hypothetical protein
MTAPNPVVSTLRYFRKEYEAHIREKHCPAGVCAMTERPPLDLAWDQMSGAAWPPDEDLDADAHEEAT